jgi:signal transduction histidine kinase
MDEPISKSEFLKMRAILRYAPVGLVEINPDGTITNINIKAEEILAPLFKLTGGDNTNILPVLQYIKPELAEKIKGNKLTEGIIFRDIYELAFLENDKSIVKYFNMMSNVQIDQSIMFSFDDVTERHESDAAMHEAETEKAVEQGKYEIASDVLHDIGNAIVGFGSYLTRIKRSVQNNNMENLQRLSLFLGDKKEALATSLGEAKADALIDMLNGITHSQQTSKEEIQHAVTEQLNIISHIQEILDIQRQYVTGESKKRKPVNLRGVINDCMAMLFASYDKRGIDITLNLNHDVPLLEGDRTKLMQVVLNILKNSLEAIDTNAPMKKIAIELYHDSDGITLHVKDSGSGFDKATAEKLFERGFTTKSSGTGIGLNNCKTIVESHSGTLEMKSDGIDKGSETKIRFPRVS